MNTKDKKAIVLALISETTDGNLIDEVYDMLHPETAVEILHTEELPGALQQKISKALDDYQSGNYITHGEMKQKLQHWLSSSSGA